MCVFVIFSKITKNYKRSRYIYALVKEVKNAYHVLQALVFHRLSRLFKSNANKATQVRAPAEPDILSNLLYSIRT